MFRNLYSRWVNSTSRPQSPGHSGLHTDAEADETTIVDVDGPRIINPQDDVRLARHHRYGYSFDDAVCAYIPGAYVYQAQVHGADQSRLRYQILVIFVIVIGFVVGWSASDLLLTLYNCIFGDLLVYICAFYFQDPEIGSLIIFVMYILLLWLWFHSISEPVCWSCSEDNVRHWLSYCNSVKLQVFRVSSGWWIGDFCIY